MSDSLHVVCPHCHGTNRLPAARLGESPKCGRCKQPLFTGAPLELTGANFASHINNSDLPVLVDFWAPWCGPCKMMAPAFAQTAAAMEPRLRLVKVNTEEQQQLAGQYAIRSIPTLVLFRNGRETDRMSGALNAAQLQAWVQQRI